MTSNYDEIMELADRADKLMEKVDQSFMRMTRGGVINTSLGTEGMINNLRKANKIFKKIGKLSKEGLDGYTDEEKKQIEAKAMELTGKYKRYLDLISQANDVAKGFMKQAVQDPVGIVVDAAKELVGKGKKEDEDDATPEGVSE